MAIWTIAYAWGSAYSMALNGFGLLRLQVLLGGTSVVMIFTLAGPVGYMWGQTGIIVAYVLASIPGVIGNPIVCYAPLYRSQKTTKKNRELVAI